MSKGLEDAGLNVVAGIDIWDKAIDSYKENFNHLSICETTFFVGVFFFSIISLIK